MVGPLLPGQEAHACDSGAGDQAVSTAEEAEGVLGDAGDARVVADDPRQAGGAQHALLAGGEHARILVPQPVHGKENSMLPMRWIVSW